MKHTKAILLALSAAALWSCNQPAKPVVETSRLPQDVNVLYPLSDSVFNSWFAGNKVTENGLAVPANSVAFPHVDNNSFYQWSEQMFLWITSPVKSGAYEKGNTVLESPIFYDVTPTNDSGVRVLKQHGKDHVMSVLSHISQTGPNRLPVIMDKRGRLYEIEASNAHTKGLPMVKDATGKDVALDHVESTAGGAHTFIAKGGKPITAPKAIIQHTANAKRIVHQFMAGNKPVYLTADGTEIQTEEGQATGNVLMAQNGSMVYYVLMVNDVYAQFLTGAKGGKLNGAQFPTTAGGRDSICAFARGNGVPLPDSNALAIELKTSWVEAVNLPDIGSYITAEAMIPVYDTSNPNKWVPKGQRKATLALIGMHIVGSLAGHPEMAWATFEHNNNAPNATYQYVDSTNKVKTVPQDTGKGWLLTANTADANPNIGKMSAHGDTIVRDTLTISPSNTLRTMPWGSALDSVTNPQDKSSAASNSEVIAINNKVHKMLMGKDIRNNYILIGATWTDGGAPPTGNSYSPTDTAPGVAIGTSVLANSTMETYLQSTTTSCFTCHSSPKGVVFSVNPDSISHVYSEIQALPSVPKSMKK